MAGKIKKAPVIAILVVAALAALLIIGRQHGLIGPASGGSAVVPVAVQLPTLNTSSGPVAGVTLSLPSTQPAAMAGAQIRVQEMAWNSQTALNFANGGPVTTQGSLMQKHGVNLKLIWEDNVDNQGTALVNFAKAFKGGNPQPTEGAHFMAIMGDGAGATISNILKDVTDLGLHVEIVAGSVGFSRGEDKLMGPPDWIVTDPSTGQKKVLPARLKGSLIAGYLRDGDWNIALKLAGDNDVKNNPDEKTWDPDAINWYSAPGYIEAADAYINGVCEDRFIVKNGKRTGDKQHICVNAVVTWTPGDVNIAEKKGGLVSIVSTKEYNSQMPNTLIGIREWDQANSNSIVEMLAAAFEGSDQVKSFPQALTRGCEASSEIWQGVNGAGKQPASYWETYFKGVTKTDKTGIMVDLGGSSVNNLNDNLLLYGYSADGVYSKDADVYRSVYTKFSDIVKQQYPKLVKKMLPYDEAINFSYLQGVLKKFGQKALTVAADAPKFQANTEIKTVRSSKPWHINFDTGKATFTPDAIGTLNELRNDANIANVLAIEIHGNTDNTGDPTKNKALSEERAQAVKTWLMQAAPTQFPANRFSKVDGQGSDVPLSPPSLVDTPAGRAMNRRVDIVFGN